MQITCVIKSFNVSKPFISRESQYINILAHIRSVWGRSDFDIGMSRENWKENISRNETTI